jgi:hypothetical protein
MADKKLGGNCVILRGSQKEAGQSTTEFALTLILLMGFVFFFMQISLIFGFGNYAHYATFMSARAYLSAGANRDDQIDRAKNVIIRTLKQSAVNPSVDRFPAIAKGTGGGDPQGFNVDSPEYVPGNSNLSWLQGVRYTFRSKLFLIPLGGKSTDASGNSANQVTLTSESWLLREPTEDECESQLGKVSGIYDNGC